MNTEIYKNKRHHGVICPMITPLTPSGDLDEQSVRAVIDHLISGGIHGIFVLGTTGEAASLPLAIRTKLVKIAVDHVGGRVEIYAGLADNCLADAVDSAKRYLDLGVETIVTRLPSFYHLNPQEQLDFFADLVEHISGNIMIYNMPDLTGISIPIPVIDKLSLHPRVIGVKDSENDAERLLLLIDKLGGRSDFSVFTGPAYMSVKMLTHGSDGIIPGFSNLLPGLCVELYNSVVNEDHKRAEELQIKLTSVGKICQNYSAISALKCAMSISGFCGPSAISPLRTLNLEEQENIKRRMTELDLLPKPASCIL